MVFPLSNAQAGPLGGNIIGRTDRKPFRSIGNPFDQTAQHLAGTDFGKGTWQS